MQPRETTISFVCATCRKEDFFVPRRGSQRKYCSIKCKKKAEYLRNRDKYITRAENWIENNREKHNEYSAKTYQKNLEENRRKARETARENRKKPEKREKMRESYRKWYYSGGKAIKAEWIRNNRERANFLTRRRIARRKSAKGTYTFDEWNDLLVEYKHTCLCCKKKEPKIKLSVDHITPLTKGGSNYIQNIQPLCISCNSRKNNKTIDYRELVTP